MLKLEGVNAGYGKVQVLRDVSLSVEERRIVTLLGANGAGKSTTLKVICGLHRLTRGSVRFSGRPIEKASPHDIVRAGISIVLEGRLLFVGMSVAENLELGPIPKEEKRT